MTQLIFSYLVATCAEREKPDPSHFAVIQCPAFPGTQRPSRARPSGTLSDSMGLLPYIYGLKLEILGLVVREGLRRTVGDTVDTDRISAPAESMLSAGTDASGGFVQRLSPHESVMEQPKQRPANRRAATEASTQVIGQLAKELDASSRTPLYEQLRHALFRLIETNVLPPGTALPPEPLLAEQLGVSRQTVGRALDGLARRGALLRRRGAGTFVAEVYVEQPLNKLYSFLRTLVGQGWQPTRRLLGYRLAVDDQASLLLTGSAEGLVFEFERLLQLDGEPCMVESIALPREYGEAIPLDSLVEGVLYDLLQERCGVTITHADETLRPINLGPREAALLHVGTGEAALLVERTGYAAETAVELRRSIIRGDRYRFRIRLEGDTLAGSHV